MWNVWRPGGRVLVERTVLCLGQLHAMCPSSLQWKHFPDARSCARASFDMCCCGCGVVWVHGVNPLSLLLWGVYPLPWLGIENLGVRLLLSSHWLVLLNRSQFLNGVCPRVNWFRVSGARGWLDMERLVASSRWERLFPELVMFSAISIISAWLTTSFQDDILGL